MLRAECFQVAIATRMPVLDSSLANSDLLLRFPQDVDAVLFAPLSTLKISQRGNQARASSECQELSNQNHGEISDAKYSLHLTWVILDMPWWLVSQWQSAAFTSSG